jgi:hypothetical protein
MKLFVRIVDPTGLTDGLQGWCQDFATLAESDEELLALQEAGIASVARTEAELEATVGPDIWPYYVPAPLNEDGTPNVQCAGWRYENGQFIDPEA